ncbi:MAG TPA: molecular chaperone HtpG [Bacilli bacterium]|nr:molecular chaperone HtpG [Bacilli bacterium]
MTKKQFKAESKKLMDLMINSIYTNKEIFLRELISNASDAIDKLYYNSLTDKSIKVDKNDLEINIKLDENNRTLTISDNGIGMSKEELENNLGTIAKSGSLAFKQENEHKKDIDIIGQFGVGFYSSFMVAKSIKVVSKPYGSDTAYVWESSGVDGFTITEGKKETNGTDVILTLKDDDDDENYSEYLHDHFIMELVHKYSNYITYPIKMEVSHHELKEGSKDEYEDVKKIETINDMVPIWKRDNVSDEEYNTFYKDKFNDYEDSIKVIKSNVECLTSYKALLFIPSKAPYDFYTKEYEKGLQLYSNGVLIMDKCSDLLPDYYSFVKGVVDSEDLSLNISRETLQQNKTLKVIAKSIETKIQKELLALLNDNREKYEEFYKSFGINLKYGIYANYGMNKDKLEDLIMFNSSKDKKFKTFKEYVKDMKESQKKIYYLTGESLDKIDSLPIMEEFKDNDIEVLYSTDSADDIILQMLNSYDSHPVVNASIDNSDLSTDEEKDEIKKYNEENKDMLEEMKTDLNIGEVRFTNKLKGHPVSLTSKGNISIDMEKAINGMPGDQNVTAEKVLEINESHAISNKLKDLYKNNHDEFEKLSKILYQEARIIEGLPIENPTELTNLICEELSK